MYYGLSLRAVRGVRRFNDCWVARHQPGMQEVLCAGAKSANSKTREAAFLRPEPRRRRSPPVGC